MARWTAGVAVASGALLAASGAQAATVTVRGGESLGLIAARNDVSVSALVAANGIANPNRVLAGRVLRLPTSATAAGGAASGAAGSGVHRVRPGETLWSIAALHGVSVGHLVRLNDIANADRLSVGRLLRLPASDAAASPAPAPAEAAPPSAPVAPPGADWSRAHVAGLLADSAARQGVDPALARAIAWQESGWGQGVVSNVGAVGVMQLMPGTAAWVGRILLGRPIDASVVEDNVEGGVAYLGWLLRTTGDTRTAIASYYQGLSSVRSRGLLGETRRYVANVLALVGRV